MYNKICFEKRYYFLDRYDIFINGYFPGYQNVNLIARTVYGMWPITVRCTTPAGGHIEYS